MLTVGLISDTHGLLRPEAFDALRDSDHIIHAGDIGDPEILRSLARIAPVTAVRGNRDYEEWAVRINETEMVEVGALTIYVIHDLAQLDLEPAAAGIDVVICGHSHRPKSERRDGVLFVNPGSAGPCRFKLPVSVARLTLNQTDLRVQLITLGSH